MAVSVTNDFTVLDAFDNATDQDSDGSTFGNTGSVNLTLKVQGTAANYYQAKGIGVGTAGKYNAANNWNIASTHLYCWFRNLDYFNTEANDGVRIRYTNTSLSGNANYGEWTVGGNDTLRATIDGFTRVAVDTTRTPENTSGTPPATSSVDGLGIGGDAVSQSGQNTMFVDQMMTGDLYTIGGGGTSTRGNSSEIAAYDYTNGYGVFKDTSGVYFVLVGLTFGNTGTASSYYLDEGQVLLFEPQNVSSTLYTVTFSGNATGTNVAEFGSSSGTGDDETGTGGNTFVANNQPFNIVCTDSNIDVGFYGCTFLNAGSTAGTIKLEQANAAAVSSLVEACGIITVKNSAVMKKTTVVGTASTTHAVEVQAGTFTGNIVDGATTGVYYPGTHTRTVRNNTYSNNTVGIEFDTAQTVTLDNEQFSGNTYDIENSSGATGGVEGTADSYSETNQSLYISLNNTNHGLAQSFTGDGNELSRCEFYLRKVASPTGNAVAKLYAHSGTFGTSSIPTGTALATSDNFDVTTITTSFALHNFNFSTPYTLVNGTKYVIALEYINGDATNTLRWGDDNTAPTHAGNSSVATTSFVWTSRTRDFCFYVFTTTPVVGSGALIADSYSETNQNATTALDGSPTGVGQSITGNGGVLSNIRWYLSKTGTPAGNMVCKLYAHSGTFGTSSIPTGSVLATSVSVLADSLTTSLVLTQFEFEDQFTLVNTTKYVATLEYTGAASNQVNVGTDTTTPTHGGNFSTLVGTWSAVAGTDAPFYADTGGILIVNATNGANPGTKINTSAIPGAVIIQNAVTLKITVRDRATKALIQNAQTSIRMADSPFTELMNEDTTVLGVAEEAYNYGGSPVDVVIRVRKSEDTDSPRYVAFSDTGQIGANGLTLDVSLRENTFI